MAKTPWSNSFQRQKLQTLPEGVTVGNSLGEDWLWETVSAGFQALRVTVVIASGSRTHSRKRCRMLPLVELPTIQSPSLRSRNGSREWGGNLNYGEKSRFPSYLAFPKGLWKLAGFLFSVITPPRFQRHYVSEPM